MISPTVRVLDPVPPVAAVTPAILPPRFRRVAAAVRGRRASTAILMPVPRDGPRPTRTGGSRVRVSSSRERRGARGRARGASASSSDMPCCSYADRRSLRRQTCGSAASSCASAIASSSACAGLAEPVREAHAQRLVAGDAATGQDQVERVAQADEPREPHGAAVDQRDAPTAAEHAEDGVASGDAQIAPQRELEPARDGVPLDRRDHRLGRGASGTVPSGRRRRPRPGCPGRPASR